MSTVPLVLVPGMGCSPALWSLLDLDVAPITPVLEEASVEAEVDRLLAMLPERFDLAALSVGAVVALALVRRAPERVTRLALMSTNPHGPTDGQRDGWASQRRTLAHTSPRGLQESLLSGLLSPTVIGEREDLVELTVGMADEIGGERYDRQLRLQATRVDERPCLARIRCPTLVAAAADDRLCGVSRHEEIARLVPRATLAVIGNCAHLSPLERPQQVSALLRSWRGQHPGSFADVSPR